MALPGGLIVFPGGGQAETVTRDFRRMTNRDRYLLFLRRTRLRDTDVTATITGEGYVLAHGGQGLFSVPVVGLVLSHGLPRAPVSVQYNRMDAQQFLESVRLVVASAGR